MLTTSLPSTFPSPSTNSLRRREEQVKRQQRTFLLSSPLLPTTSSSLHLPPRGDLFGQLSSDFQETLPIRPIDTCRELFCRIEQIEQGVDPRRKSDRAWPTPVPLVTKLVRREAKLCPNAPRRTAARQCAVPNCPSLRSIPRRTIETAG